MAVGIEGTAVCPLPTVVSLLGGWRLRAGTAGNVERAGGHRLGRVGGPDRRAAVGPQLRRAAAIGQQARQHSGQMLRIAGPREATCIELAEQFGNWPAVVGLNHRHAASPASRTNSPFGSR